MFLGQEKAELIAATQRPLNQARGPRPAFLLVLGCTGAAIYGAAAAIGLLRHEGNPYVNLLELGIAFTWLALFGTQWRLARLRSAAVELLRPQYGPPP